MLDLVQIILSLTLMTCIVLQAKSGGLGSALGGGSYHTKRGAEKSLFYLTIVVAVLFVVLSGYNSLL